MKSSDEISDGLEGFVSLTLMRGCDDYVMAFEIVDNIFNIDAVFQSSVSPEVLLEIAKGREIGDQVMFAIARDMSIAIIRKMLTEGLMEIGDLWDAFHPWPVSIEASLERVRAEWDELNGKLPGLGVYWLANTELGEARGKEALKLWQEDREKPSPKIPRETAR